MTTRLFFICPNLLKTMTFVRCLWQCWNSMGTFTLYLIKYLKMPAEITQGLMSCWRTGVWLRVKGVWRLSTMASCSAYHYNVASALDWIWIWISRLWKILVRKVFYNRTCVLQTMSWAWCVTQGMDIKVLKQDVYRGTPTGIHCHARRGCFNMIGKFLCFVLKIHLSQHFKYMNRR